ncbi:MAG: hypothetical protein ACLFR1_04345 [Spirochaetia bacterium]
MLISLVAAVHPWFEAQWTESMEKQLGSEFISVLKNIYDHFHLGCDFSEFAVKYKDQKDVEGFISFVESMDAQRFTFYVLSRLYPLEKVPETPTKDSVYQLDEKHGNLKHHQHVGMTFEWANFIKQVQSELARLWRIYWNEYLSCHIKEYHKNI